MLEVLSGTLGPTSGTAQILGRPPADRALVTQLGYQPEGPLPFPALCASEFLAYLAALMRLPRDRARRSADEWLERLDLKRAGRRPIGTYSTGMGRRLALAAALLADPEVILLDEPTSGIDPAGSLTVLEILEEKAAAGGTVLMTSHHLQEVEQICHRVYLLEFGRCRAQGSLDELLGTGDHTLVVRGLDDAGLAQVRAAVAEAGGDLVRSEPARRHLFALFRSLDSTPQQRAEP